MGKMMLVSMKELAEVEVSPTSRKGSNSQALKKQKGVKANYSSFKTTMELVALCGSGCDPPKCRAVFMILDDMVEEVEEENVVQVVIDNVSAYVVAGRLLTAKHQHLYWTLGAVHCIDLMLEDIGKIPKMYMGGGACVWFTGLPTKAEGHKKALETLRIKYTAKILLGEGNQFRNEIKAEVDKFYSRGDEARNKILQDAANSRDNRMQRY
ncbi:hypothetical protein OSB04_028252 [Centaurea solstitialis]|uniref:DUF659 domain-containing protein n=1 Tax=Centaurea solstitialis TaxID=347529 RepID=A0AA38WAZ6_9ASTR|nr:hypothetical protein OSB04_028252 [Centaurea solstitialis]